MKNYQALLFDLDDTLLAFAPSEKTALKALHQQYFKKTREDILIGTYRKINHALWIEVEQGLRDIDSVRLERFEKLTITLGHNRHNHHELADFYELKLSESYHWLPDAETVYKTLRQSHKVAIVTNGITSVQKGRCRAAGINELLVIAQEVGFHKPHPKIFEHTITQLQINKEHMLMIGDRLSSDYQGALACGIDFCWYNPDNKPLEANYPQPKYIVKNLMELQGLLVPSSNR